jgi:hypothetical protein
VGLFTNAWRTTTPTQLQALDQDILPKDERRNYKHKRLKHKPEANRQVRISIIERIGSQLTDAITNSRATTASLVVVIFAISSLNRRWAETFQAGRRE